MGNNDEYIKGRGAQFNPHNRFEQNEEVKLHPEGIDDWEEKDIKTNFLETHPKTIVNKVTSPDVPMDFSINPYQGCEHGCVYCYARNSHEYWGFSAGMDFESNILIKKNAPDLLRKFFDNKNYQPVSISLSGNTDCYQPIEQQLKITRSLLEVCLEYGNPVGIITKNQLVLRDLDLLQELNKRNLIMVYTSITGVDENIRMKLEPRTSTYKSRFKIINKLAENNIPCGIMNAPIIPGINDHEMHDVVRLAAENGAKSAGYLIVRLNGAIGGIFKDWLFKTYPDRAEKVWHHIQSCHNGSVNDSRFGTRMRGEGNIAEIIGKQFALYCNKYGLNKERQVLDLTHFKRPKRNGQMELF